MGISLIKGQKISLSKISNGNLNKVLIGLGWDPADDDDDIDLDASCILFSAEREKVDHVYFGKKKSKDKSIKHHGDNLTGEGEGDDEQITIELSKVDPNVKHIVFVVTSYSGQPFDKIRNAFCRIEDKANTTELARYNLSTGGKYKGLVIARLYRHNNEWKMAAIGEYSPKGETYKDMIKVSSQFL